MLPDLSSVSPQLLVRPHVARPQNFKANAPVGYRAPEAGAKAGQRIHPGSETLATHGQRPSTGQGVDHEGRARARAETASSGTRALDADDEASALEAPGSELETDGDEASEHADGQQPQQLSEAEQAEVRKLQARDREVRVHEQAHAAAGGRYAGSPSYDYERGPDGRQYVVGGEVSIDVAPISGDPRATMQKMQVVRRAALAPAQPSGQDRSVAAQASQQEANARMELAQETREAQDETPANGAQSATTTNPATDDAESLRTADVHNDVHDSRSANGVAGARFAGAVRDQRGSLFATRAYLAHAQFPPASPG